MVTTGGTYTPDRTKWGGSARANKLAIFQIRVRECLAPRSA